MHWSWHQITARGHYDVKVYKRQEPVSEIG